MKCPQCQLEIPEDSKFCKECGHPLIETPDTEKAPRIISSERKHVTIMFSDLSGYTAMTERLDPEEVKEIMSYVFGEITQIIHNYDGFIERFVGDAVMVIFGVPKVHEDDPVRAIMAAREIHAFVEGYSPQIEKKIGNRLTMHTGINTGLVVTGEVDIAKGTHGLTGDAINLASRLEHIAKAGEIVVGPATYRRSKGNFSFQALKPIRLKGIADRIQAYKVLSSKTHAKRPRIGLKRRIYSEMVGREKELNKLELQLAKAIDGDGSVVNIIGEAGIGKSRLFAELKNRGSLKRVMLLEGKAISIGRNLAFHPIIDLLKHWARIGGNDSEATALSKLESAVQNVCKEDADEIVPFLATLMGMQLLGRYAERVAGIDGGALEKLILKNVRDLLSKASELIPLVIVMEDLHWADTSSIELLESLFRLAESKSILFVNLFRPDHAETGERIVAALKEKLSVYHVEIILRSLNESMSEKLISNMLNIGDLNYTFKNKIIKRTGGNPFFIEEIVLSLVDEGFIVPKKGKFEINKKIAEMVVPPTINDVLDARIDRLEKETRNLVKIASVIGRNSFYRILTNVATAIEDIDGHLSYLKKIQIIMERMRLDELEFLFKHALVQEAAYRSILHGKRKALHLHVAKTIESLFTERLHEFYGMLALHYSRGQDYENAEHYLTKAGAEALKSSASKEALHYYQEALNLFLKESDGPADSAKQAMLQKNIALAFYYRGQYDEAVDYFDKALSFYWGRLPENRFSMAFRFLSAFCHILISLYCPFLKFRKTITTEEIQNLELFYKKSKALAIINPLRFFIESIYIWREVTRYKLSNFDLGLKICVAASSLFTFTGISFRLSRKIIDSAREKIPKDHAKIYIIYVFMETIHNYLVGNWDIIGSPDPELGNRSLKDGEIYLPSQLLYWHGCRSIYGGDQDRAQNIIDELTNIVEVYENDFSILLNYMLKSKYLMEYRHLNEALAEIGRGIEFCKIKGFTITLLDFYSCQARIFMFMQNADQAAQSIRLADGIRSSVHAAPIQFSIYYRSQLEFSLFQLEKALQSGHAKRAAGHKKRAGHAGKMLIKAISKAAQHRTEAFKLKGIYYWLLNKPKPALKWMQKAVSEGNRLNARLELSRTYFEVGKRLMEGGPGLNSLNGLTAVEYLDKAKLLFEEMGLEWDLEKLKRLERQ